LLFKEEDSVLVGDGGELLLLEYGSEEDNMLLLSFGCFAKEPLDDKIQRKSGEHHILPPDP
jgi:hypothetical protein